jgi:hypothetical protein
MIKSMGFYAGRFAIWYLVALVALQALSFALFRFAPAIADRLHEGPGSSGVTVATLIVPTFLVAGQFFRHEQRQTTRSEGWRLSVVFALVTFAISFSLFALLNTVAYGSVLGGPDTRELLSQTSLMAGIVAGFFVLLVVVYRLLLWSAIRGEIKRKARRTEVS